MRNSRPLMLRASGIGHPRHPRQSRNGAIFKKERSRECLECVARYRPLGAVKERAHGTKPVYIFIKSALQDRETVFGKHVEFDRGLLSLAIRRHACGHDGHGNTGTGRE